MAVSPKVESSRSLLLYGRTFHRILDECMNFEFNVGRFSRFIASNRLPNFRADEFRSWTFDRLIKKNPALPYSVRWTWSVSITNLISESLSDYYGYFTIKWLSKRRKLRNLCNNFSNPLGSNVRVVLREIFNQENEYISRSSSKERTL